MERLERRSSTLPVLYSDTISSDILNPYTADAAFVLCASQIGFPLATKEDTDNLNMRVFVDSSETVHKLQAIQARLSKTTVWQVLVSDATRVRYLLEGNESEFTADRYTGDEKLFPIEKLDKRVLEEVVMRNWEDEALAWHVADPNGERTPDEVFETARFVSNLEAKGVKPIGVEQIGMLLFPRFVEIIRNNPELQPKNPRIDIGEKGA